MPPLEAWHRVFDGQLSILPTAVQLRGLLEDLVVQTGLEAISPVKVWLTAPSWSAFVMIAESHISAHGHGCVAWVDVFSCLRFDGVAVQAVIEKHLGGSWQSQWVRCPTAIEGASPAC